MVHGFPTDDMELTHILVVSELERSVSFYRDILGADLQREYGGSSAVLSFQGAWLLLVTGGGPTADKPTVTFEAPTDPDRVSHSMTIRVPDCRSSYEVLRSRGAEFLTEPVETEWEIRGFFRDPDGHLIEISQSKGQGSAATDDPGKEILSWEKLDGLVARLAAQLAAGPQPDVVLAISRGGLVPAGMISYRLGWRDMLVASVVVYDEGGFRGHAEFLQFPADEELRDKNVLVIDEVWDSGTTIAAVADRIIRAGGRPTTAVIHYKPDRSRVDIVPDHFVVETDAWIVYPFKAGD